MMKHASIFFPIVCSLAVAVLCSCASRIQAPCTASLSPTRVRTWEGRAFDRVVGYRFANSAEWRSVLRLDLKQVDLAYLQKMKRNEAELNEAQTDQLMDAIHGTRPTAEPAVCYEPHHIFLFHAKDQLVGAFEFCLQCQQYRAWPRRELRVNENYVKLAALCRELGLGVKPPQRWRP